MLKIQLRKPGTCWFNSSIAAQCASVIYCPYGGIRRGRAHAVDRKDVLIQIPVKCWIKLKTAFP